MAKPKLKPHWLEYAITLFIILFVAAMIIVMADEGMALKLQSYLAELDIHVSLQSIQNSCTWLLYLSVLPLGIFSSRINQRKRALDDLKTARFKGVHHFLAQRQQQVKEDIKQIYRYYYIALAVGLVALLIFFTAYMIAYHQLKIYFLLTLVTARALLWIGGVFVFIAIFIVILALALKRYLEKML